MLGRYGVLRILSLMKLKKKCLKCDRNIYKINKI